MKSDLSMKQHSTPNSYSNNPHQISSGHLWKTQLSAIFRWAIRADANLAASSDT